jgi:tetratricopeptide (TPR) repeat protein
MDEAIEIQRRVVASDPISRVPRVNLANTLLAAGRLEEARAEFLRYVEMGARPDPDVDVDLARIDLLAGRHPQALAQAEKWRDGPDRDFVLALAADAPGRRSSAEARLLAGTDPVHAVRLAELYAHREKRDQAFRWMDVAYDRLGPSPWLTDQWQWMYHLRFSPFLRPLHGDARWLSTLQRAVRAAKPQSPVPEVSGS